MSNAPDMPDDFDMDDLLGESNSSIKKDTVIIPPKRELIKNKDYWEWELQYDADQIVMELHAVTLKLPIEGSVITISSPDPELPKYYADRLMALFNHKEVMAQIDFEAFYRERDKYSKC
jgi:hypothetical protein